MNYPYERGSVGTEEDWWLLWIGGGQGATGFFLFEGDFKLTFAGKCMQVRLSLGDGPGDSLSPPLPSSPPSFSLPPLFSLPLSLPLLSLCLGSTPIVL